MTRLLTICALAVIAALMTPTAMAKQTPLGTVSGQHLSAELPHGWRVLVGESTSPASLTVKLLQGTAPDAVLDITIMPPPGPVTDSDKASMVYAAVSQSAAQASAQSVEGHLATQPFSSGEVRGAYFSATDKAPGPGGYKYMTQGVATVGDEFVTFTALSNADPDGFRATLLKVVGSLHSAPAN